MKWFLIICFAHFAEHIAQAFQVYVLNWPTHEAGGLLGFIFPWLAHSEVLHYFYALFMLSGLWIFRTEFDDAQDHAKTMWMLAFGVQFWHHFEHVLLIAQAACGDNFCGASQPISLVQFTGYLYGTPEDNFGGLLSMSHFGACNCEGATPGTVHTWTPALLTVRRLEVHLIYNIMVMMPMSVALICWHPRYRNRA